MGKASTHLSKKGESRLKMVAYSKIVKEKPVVWYSPIKDNKKNNEQIIEGMMKRFKENYNINFYRTVLFFDEFSGSTQIEKINL